MSPTKTEIFQIKNSNIFHISAQNIGCGYSLEPPRRGGSNEYPQSLFLIRLLDPGCWYKFTYFVTNSADQDQLAS